MFISSLFHLICLCCYLTAPFSKESCQKRKISIKQSVILPPYRPSSLVLLPCRLSLSVPAFHNKRRWMSLILCCIVISIIHGTDRSVLGEWVTVEWGGLGMNIHKASESTPWTNQYCSSVSTHVPPPGIVCCKRGWHDPLLSQTGVWLQI